MITVPARRQERRAAAPDRMAARDSCGSPGHPQYADDARVDAHQPVKLAPARAGMVNSSLTGGTTGAEQLRRCAAARRRKAAPPDPG